jgi:serine/threonine-protein phosphatase 6 regulatory subunit 3
VPSEPSLRIAGTATATSHSLAMFWRVSGLNTACPVDAILDKEAFTLEELLDEDELVQECKSLNPRLIEFLKKKENVEALVRYMVVEEGDDAHGIEECRNAGLDAGEEAGAGAGAAADDGRGDAGQAGQGGQGGQGAVGAPVPGALGTVGGVKAVGDVVAGEVAGEVSGEVSGEVAGEVAGGAPNRDSFDSTVSQDSQSDTRRYFKYPFTACEIFCCEVEGIYNTLLENEDVLGLFFIILNKKRRPLNTILAGYFSRVMGALLARRSSDVVLYLQANPSILDKLVYHVDTTSVAEVLARLAGADDPVGYSDSPGVVWLASTNVLQLLVKSLGSDTPSEGQANAAEVLAAIARSTATQLTRSMANESFMQELVDAALADHSGAAASHALNVCLALLEPLTVDPAMGRFPVTDIHDVLRQEAVRCLSQEETLQKLVRLLDVTERRGDELALSELSTTYGHIKPPVGQLRLKIVDLLASLFRTTEPLAERAIINTMAVTRAMDMFLEYPFNNALHGGVTMLLTAFEEGSEELRRYLMEEAKLIEWLVHAPRTLTNASAEKTLISLRKENTVLRAGYCGHLTQIANRLQRCAETCEYMKEYLEKNEEWNEYKDQELDARNRVESVLAWKCGRPASQGMGLHGMYSNGLGYGSMRHGDDGIGDDDFDSDHNRFAPVGGGIDTEGDHGANGDIVQGDVTQSEEDALEVLSGAGDAIKTGLNDTSNKKMSHASSGELSMDDMADDEVCFDMEDSDEIQKEADATDGLLELGESLDRLAVGDGDDSGSPAAKAATSWG